MSSALIFPGQGAQAVGMGRDLYDHPLGRAVFDAADAALGWPLSALCFEGPESALTATENAQPAIMTVSVALLAVLAGGLAAVPGWAAGRAAFVAGHSLGEYSALVAAGVLDLRAALPLVRRRGELMAGATQGSMAAVIALGLPELEAICAEAAAPDEPVVIANYNAPGQLVISGAAAAVDRAAALARERGARRVLPLKVSAAFHSPLMADAASQLAPSIAAAALSDAHVPVVSNVLAAPLQSAEAIRSELAAQITAPVRWIASVERMVADGVDTFVEVGPGSVLTGMLKRTVSGVRLVTIQTLADVRSFLDGGVAPQSLAAGGGAPV